MGSIFSWLWTRETLFKYRRLTQSPFEIRLLHLHPGLESEPLEVSLFTTPFVSEQRPAYEALSYAWGSGIDPVKITTNGRLMPVWQNLEQALRHLRLADKKRTLWVDAICIDQSSNEEKSEQVARMGDIYHEADAVIVWLGPEAEDSSRAMQVLSSFGSLVTVDEARQKNIMDDYTPVQICEAMKQDERSVVAIEQLLIRPWFNRLWIWQEVKLAKKVLVCCGKHSMPWSHLQGAISLMLPTHASPLSNVESIISERPAIPLKVRTILRPGKGGDGLLGNLYHSNRSSCTDPRDRVYALLSLQNPQEAIHLTPDYDKNVEQVFQDLVVESIGVRNNLNFLEFCSMPESGSKMPSWVTDWSKPLSVRRRMTSAYAHAGYQYECLVYRAQGILSVAGVLWDTIETAMEVNSPEMASKDVHATWGISDIEAFAKRNYLDGGSLLDAYLSTLVCNTTGSFLINHTADFPTLEEYKEVYINQTNPDTILRDSKRTACLVRYINEVADHMAGRTFFVTKRGYIGLASGMAQVGDELCVVLGCQWPLILRRPPVSANPVQNDTHQLVGNCYTHGLMNGEALLGPLPEHFRNQYIHDGSTVYKRFLDIRTGELLAKDPRDGPVPGWETLRDERGSSYFVNSETGEKSRIPPRLRDEFLEPLGVKLRRFNLV